MLGKMKFGTRKRPTIQFGLTKQIFTVSQAQLYLLEMKQEVLTESKNQLPFGESKNVYNECYLALCPRNSKITGI